MPAGKSPAPVELVRDDTDNHRTLARIAARLLAVAELENEALAEIDRIASGIEREVRAKYIPVAVVAGFISSFVLVGLLVWIIAAFTGNNLGWRPVAAIVPMILLAAAPALYWRHFQYGLGPIRAKRPALYAGGSKATTDTLEKLFDYLGRRIADSDEAAPSFREDRAPLFRDDVAPSGTGPFRH